MAKDYRDLFFISEYALLNAETCPCNYFLEMSHMKTTWDSDFCHGYQHVSKELSAGGTACDIGVKDLSKQYWTKRQGAIQKAFNNITWLGFLKCSAAVCEIHRLSFSFSHYTCEFVNGKGFFFILFESQANSCLESLTILMTTALKKLNHFNLLDIFCSEKWKFGSPGPFGQCYSLSLCGKCSFPGEYSPAHLNGTT